MTDNRAIVAINYAGMLKYVGTPSDDDPALCRLIHLPDGDARFYPVAQCKAVSRAKALELAIASGMYADMSVRDLGIAFGIANTKGLLEGIVDEPQA